MPTLKGSRARAPGSSLRLTIAQFMGFVVICSLAFTAVKTLGLALTLVLAFVLGGPLCGAAVQWARMRGGVLGGAIGGAVALEVLLSGGILYIVLFLEPNLFGITSHQIDSLIVFAFINALSLALFGGLFGALVGWPFQVLAHRVTRTRISHSIYDAGSLLDPQWRNHL
jgi:hypothetical protein